MTLRILLIFLCSALYAQKINLFVTGMCGGEVDHFNLLENTYCKGLICHKLDSNFKSKLLNLKETDFFKGCLKECFVYGDSTSIFINSDSAMIERLHFGDGCLMNISFLEEKKTIVYRISPRYKYNLMEDFTKEYSMFLKQLSR